MVGAVHDEATRILVGVAQDRQRPLAGGGIGARAFQGLAAGGAQRVVTLAEREVLLRRGGGDPQRLLVCEHLGAPDLRDSGERGGLVPGKPRR